MFLLDSGSDIIVFLVQTKDLLLE